MKILVNKPPKHTIRREKRVPQRSTYSYRERSSRGNLFTLLLVFLSLLIIGMLSGVIMFLGNQSGKEVATTSTSVSLVTSAPMLPTATYFSVVSPTLTASVYSTSTTTVTKEPTLSLVEPNVPRLQQLMFTLINNDRRANGLEEVSWDSVAASAGQRHADEMARFSYVSHWNLDGYGPDHRYSLAGGTSSVIENVYFYQHTLDNYPVSQKDWEAVIKDSQKALMGNPEHRTVILNPAVTHVGIGIVYDPSNAWLGITQEFTFQYIAVSPISQVLSRGQILTLSGRVNPGGNAPLLDLAYEPFPTVKTVYQLKETKAYSSLAEVYATTELKVDNTGHFEQQIQLENQKKAGLYHIRIWVDTIYGKVMVVDFVVNINS